MNIRLFLNSRRGYFCLVATVLLLVVLSWLPQLLTFNPGISYGDEGVVAQAAKRVVGGQWPYRDFFTFFPPGTACWYGLFLLLFGQSFLALRIGVLVTALLIMVLALWVVSRVAPARLMPAMIMASFLAFFGGPYWFVASHHWFALLLCLLSLALLLPEADTGLPLRGRVFWAGAAGSGVVLVMQHKGGLWLIAASIALATVRRQQARVMLFRFWLGALAVAGLAALPFLIVVGWEALFDQLVMVPLTRYHLVPGHRGTTILKDLWTNWQNVSDAWPAAGAGFTAWLAGITWNLGFIGRAAVHLFPFCGVVGLVWLWRSSAQPRLVLSLITAFFAVSYLSALHRFHETTLVYAAPAAVLVLAVVVQECQGGDARGLWKAFPAGWSVFFFLIALGFMSIDLLPGKMAVRLPAGTVNSLYPAEAAELAGLDSFFKRYRRDNDRVFCLTYLPMLYYLFDLENPTPYDVLTPISAKDELDNVERLLEANQVRWVVRDQMSFAGVPFGRYLMSNYRERARVGNLTILERTPRQL